MENDIYLDYFRKHYSLHGTVNNIGDNDEVVFLGKTLKIGWFKRMIRNKHNYYKRGIDARGSCTALAINRYNVLDELGFEWEPQKKLTENILGNDLYIKYLQDYYREHGTINDISLTSSVEYDGKTLKIGSFIKNIRNLHRYYEQGLDIEQSFSEISLTRYSALEEMNFSWNLFSKNLSDLDEDIYIACIKDYYEKNGSLAGLDSERIIKFRGEKVNISLFLRGIRQVHRNYLNGLCKYDEKTIKLYLDRKVILDRMGFNFDENKDKDNFSFLEEDLFLEYLKEYYSRNNTINDIPTTAVVVFRGETLKIGDFLKTMRYNHKFYIDGKSRAGVVTRVALRRYDELEKLGFNWISERKETITSIARDNGLPVSTVRSLVNKFDGDIDKAIKILLLKKQREEKARKKKKDKYSLNNILDSFDVNMETFTRYLERPVVRKGKTKNKPIMVDKNMSLWDFCVSNGYNYDVVSRIVKLKMKDLCDEDLESLINRSIIEYQNVGQGRVATWVYSKYGNEILVKHMLISMNLDSSAVLKDMSQYVISLDEAIERETFRKKNGQEFSYLWDIYHEFVEFYRMVDTSIQYDEETASASLVEKAHNLVDEYHLTNEEFNGIIGAFKHYTDAIYQYHLYEVGFEKDDKKRLEKIVSYKFDSKDIEEAFFVPLRFDQKVLIGRDSELYKRRQLVRDLTISWNNLSDEEKTLQISNFGLTSLELEYISSTSQMIDTAKNKVLVI